MHAQYRTLAIQVIVLAQHGGTLGARNARQIEIRVHIEDSYS